MKRNMRVIQINGFRGLIVAFFVISCLIAGFIAFPAFIAMHTWNYVALKTGSFPVLSFAGGTLLWAIIALSIYLFNKRKFIVSFNSHQELSEDEIRNVISKIRSGGKYMGKIEEDTEIEKETVKTKTGKDV